MVHMYDSRFGPLKDVIRSAFASNVNGKQFVGEYDAHGNYFKEWCRRLNYYGFEVKETYSLSDRRLMKKILEKEKHGSNHFFDSSTKEDDEQYKKVKAAYDCLKNCNKDLVYRDADHWYIQID